MRALSPVVSIQSLSTMVFDMSAERLYVTDEEGMVTCVDVGRAYKASPSPFDLRPANTALYARRRSLKQFNDDQMPHQDPYLYTLDGEIMEAMYRDLVDTNVDISYDSEQLLFRVRESLP
jgi:hypothetical protein